MTSATQIHEIETLTDQFINRLDIKSHHDLKRIGEFKSLPSDVRGKLYDKVRYKTNKDKLKLINSQEIDSNENIKSPLWNKRNSLTIILLFFIFSFLTTEAFKFYEQFNITPLFKFLTPVSIELSILLLSLKNSKTSKYLMISLVLFNMVAITYKTIDTDENLKNAKSSQLEARERLKLEITKLERDINRLNTEHENLLMNYNELISKGFFKIAENSYSLKINKNEENKKLAEIKINKLNSEYSNSSIVSKRHNFLAFETISMITLKIILQLIFIYLLFDLKNSNKQGRT